MRIILASQSPRRRDLLARLGMDFDIMSAAIDERAVEADLTAPDGTVEGDRLAAALAEAKATHVAACTEGERLIIAADTLVMLDGRPLGKPADETDARDMLRRLCGRTHTVETGVAVLAFSETDTPRREVFVSSADVTFVPRTETVDRLIERYLATGSPFDKAGAYGIQDMGGLLVETMTGDVYAVIGLPLARLCQTLAAFTDLFDD